MQKLALILSILTTPFVPISSGCRSSHDAIPQDPPQSTLRIAAASDLQPWIGSALESWGQSQSPPIRTETVYGSSYQLATQIRAGAPVDLFLSADREAVESLSRENRIDPQSIRPYAVGRLALLTRKSLGLITLDDLPKAPFRHLAIASPETAPYGKAAKAALSSSGLWTALEPRIVIAATVRQSFQNVLDGNAEAGIVSLGHARIAAVENPELVVIEIPADLHPPLVQTLGIVSPTEGDSDADSRSKRRIAHNLAIWLASPETDELFQSHSLERPSAGHPSVKETSNPPDSKNR